MSASNSWRFWCRHQQLVAHSHLRRFSRKVMQVLLRKPGCVAIECLVAGNFLEVFRGYLVKRIICPKSSSSKFWKFRGLFFVAGRVIICGQHEQKTKECTLQWKMHTPFTIHGMVKVICDFFPKTTVISVNHKISPYQPPPFGWRHKSSRSHIFHPKAI